MTGITLNAVFVVSGASFICSNDGSIYVETDLVKSTDGTSRAVSRTKNLRAKNVFMHGEKISEGSEVICLTRMSTGNIFHYNGVMSSVGESGNVVVRLTSPSNTDKIEELIKTIASL